MKILKEMSELSPSLLRYPVEKIVRAIVNIALDRKVPGSVGRLIAAGAGICIGIYLPSISQIGILLAYLALDLNISAASALTLSTITSSWICCSFCIYITQYGFESYYYNKYGVTDPEHRLTEKDKRYIYNDNIDKTDEEINKLISTIEKRVDLVVVELQRFEQKENEAGIQHLKLILNKLKKGDLEFFEEYYDSGITTDTRQKKRYDHGSSFGRRAQSEKKYYTEKHLEENSPTDSGTEMLRAFNNHIVKKNCQNTSRFDILAINKSRL